MASGDEDKTRGTFDRLKGKAKKIYGEITDNPGKKAEGSADKLKGTTRQVKGDIKNAIEGQREREDPEDIP